MAMQSGLAFTSKAEARAWGLRVRAAIDAPARAALSRQINQYVAATPHFQDADVILTYLGAKAGELDTTELIRMAWADHKTVALPLTRPGGMMAWSRLDRLEDLAPTRFGLLEPRAEAVQPFHPRGGLCIVPGVCFRGDGHRIGLGGGYFDRFLADYTGTALALAPEVLFGIEFPVEPHDRPVAAVITESGVHETRGATSG